jgi:phosphoribosylamine--glycine ligase
VLRHEQLMQVVDEIVVPTLQGASEEGFPFKGVLFLGLMLTDKGPKLLEYNVRFGDPETQAILVRLDTDLLAIFEAIRQGTLGKMKVDWAQGASACVVAANRGYPGKYESGAVISGCEAAEGEGVQIFHAGTSFSPTGELLATGGRVLGLTAAAKTLESALAACYSSLAKLHWSGMQFRRDIGKTKPALGTTC